jgi:hypothetical protein
VKKDLCHVLRRVRVRRLSEDSLGLRDFTATLCRGCVAHILSYYKIPRTSEDDVVEMKVKVEVVGCRWGKVVVEDSLEKETRLPVLAVCVAYTQIGDKKNQN